MVYLGEKAHLGRCHGVLFGEEQLEPENTIYTRIREGESLWRKVDGRTLEWTAVWTLDGHIKISQVVFMRSRRDSGQRVCHKTLRFLS